ncbi:hypothetical protein VPHD69_0144 [Vibrio phage D69]
MTYEDVKCKHCGHDNGDVDMFTYFEDAADCEKCGKTL